VCLMAVEMTVRKSRTEPVLIGTFLLPVLYAVCSSAVLVSKALLRVSSGEPPLLGHGRAHDLVVVGSIFFLMLYILAHTVGALIGDLRWLWRVAGSGVAARIPRRSASRSVWVRLCPFGTSWVDVAWQELKEVRLAYSRDGQSVHAIMLAGYKTPLLVASRQRVRRDFDRLVDICLQQAETAGVQVIGQRWGTERNPVDYRGESR